MSIAYVTDPALLAELADYAGYEDDEVDCAWEKDTMFAWVIRRKTDGDRTLVPCSEIDRRRTT